MCPDRLLYRRVGKYVVSLENKQKKRQSIWHKDEDADVEAVR